METNKFCYLLSISDFRDKYFESFYGIFMDEETLIQAYQELETIDPRISGENIRLCDINIYKIPYNCLFYRSNSLEIDQYDFHDYINFNYMISLRDVADVMCNKIIEKLGFDFRESQDNHYLFMEKLSDFDKQFLIDFNYLDSIWKPISDMREITNNISGWNYSEQYASKHKKYTEREIMTIRFDKDGKPECCISNIYKERKEQPATFQTRLGTFVTNDQGEFGGDLTLPSGEKIAGNFFEIIECGKGVYAIDSCGHMGLGHFSLYLFPENLNIEHIYSSESRSFLEKKKNEEKLYDNLVYGAHYVCDDELYIVISGFKELYAEDGYKDYWGCTKLLIITNDEVKKIIEFEEHFSRINEMIVRDSKAYITMDKMLAVIDIQKETYKLYTTLSESDETDIVREKDL